MVEIADLANRGHAIHRKFSDFARRQLDQRDIAFFAEQLRRSAGRTNNLAAATGIQFEVVHLRARRNVPERQRIARKNVRIVAG